jgi:hypothetical protein
VGAARSDEYGPAVSNPEQTEKSEESSGTYSMFTAGFGAVDLFYW